MKSDVNSEPDIKRRVKVAFLAAVITLLLSSLLAYVGTNHLSTAKNWIGQSRHIIHNLQQVRDALHEMETEQRGFVITGHPEYLNEFTRVRDNLPKLLRDLKASIREEASHHQELLDLDANITERIAALEQVIELRKQSSSEAARLHIASGEGSRIMKAALTNLDNLKSNEEKLLSARNQGWERAERMIEAGLAIAGFVNLAVLTWLYLLIRREAFDRRIHEAEHLRAREDLEFRVSERTQELQTEISERNLMVGNLENQNQQMTLLKAMSDQLQACFTIEEAAVAISHYSQRLFPGWSGRVAMLNSSRNLIESIVHWGDLTIGADVYRPDECWALRRGRPHHIEPASGQLACSHLEKPDRKQTICIPLAAQGETLGAFHLQRASDEPLPSAFLDFTETVGEHISLVIANIRLRQVLQNQSVRDPLTGLFNRRYMEESLERELRRAFRNNRPLSVMMLDLDHFKRLNDTHGHEAGDTVLRNLGQALQKAVRGEDIPCRYGGEEFTIIMPDASESDTAVKAEKIINLVTTASFVHQGVSLGPLTVSIGLATCEHPPCEADVLIRTADRALYQAKANGRARFEIAKL